IIPYEYEHGHPFSGGMAGVKKDGKWGFITKGGKVAIPFEYEEVKSFIPPADVAPVKVKGLWGYIHKQGHMYLPAKYDKVTYFVKDASYTGFMNGRLTKVSFTGYTARVELFGMAQIIDYHGKTLKTLSVSRQ